MKSFEGWRVMLKVFLENYKVDCSLRLVVFKEGSLYMSYFFDFILDLELFLSVRTVDNKNRGAGAEKLWFCGGE